MKKVISAISAFLLVLCLGIYAGAASEPITIQVGVPKAPPALPLLYMLENKSLGDKATIKIDIWDEAETLIAMVQGGQHHMFAFPLTVVAKLHNKGLPIQLLNVNTWGVTYFVTADPDLKTWADLAGKTIYVPLPSTPPDVLTQFFLSEAGLKVGQDVKIIYASFVEIATMLAAGKIEYATLIEPQVTRALLANSKLRVAFSFENEWQRIRKDNSLIPNAGFGLASSFAKANPELVAAFQIAYAQGVQWVNDNPVQAGTLAQKYLDLNSGLVEKAIPNMGLLFKSAQDARPELEIFYTLLNNFDPNMIGGKLPGDSMYYHE